MSGLKILHVPFTFVPDPIGGTEVYVESLAREQQRCGVENVIAAPGQTSCSYQHNNLTIRRFAVSAELKDLRALYGEGDPLALQEFVRILDEERPDIVHLHAFTSGVSIRLLRAAKQRGVKVVFTYHTPTVSCQRGTLMRWGNEVCDGKLNVRTCTACVLHSLGVSRRNAAMLSHVPTFVGNLTGVAGLSGGIWTALRMTELVQLRHSCFQALMQEVDLVIALCQWTKDLLISNGVPEEKIVVSRHGLSQTPEVNGFGRGVQCSTLSAEHSPLQIAFLGRLDYTKGPDILIKAMRTLPGLAIELDLYGIIQSERDPYLTELRTLAQEDARIRFLAPIDSKDVVPLLHQYDVLAVPSRCLETGPLVVLEAFAAAVPVLGSRLGGIAELVQHGVNGLLIDPDSVAAWSKAILQCYESGTVLKQFRRGIRPPRRMKTVAEETLSFYLRNAS